LKKLMRAEYLKSCVAAITINCDEPWNALSTFQQWINILMEILEEHMKDLPLEMQDGMRKASKPQSKSRSNALREDVRGANFG